MREHTMRAAFNAWVQDRGCDTDGAWSAWQAAWKLRDEAAADAQIDLHRDIMNLRCQVPPMVVDDQAYKLGHRDARHAAAELALSAGMAGRE